MCRVYFKLPNQHPSFPFCYAQKYKIFSIITKNTIITHRIFIKIVVMAIREHHVEHAVFVIKFIFPLYFIKFLLSDNIFIFHTFPIHSHSLPSSLQSNLRVVLPSQCRHATRVPYRNRV